jgi:hypothetical protein
MPIAIDMLINILATIISIFVAAASLGFWLCKELIENRLEV